jgi:hypothetical protein
MRDASFHKPGGEIELAETFTDGKARNRHAAKRIEKIQGGGAYGRRAVSTARRVLQSVARPKAWMGAEPRIWGDEVTLAVAHESGFEHTRNSDELSPMFAAISGFLSRLGMTVSVAAIGFSAEISFKPFMGGAEWDPGDVAPWRVQVGQRQFGVSRYPKRTHRATKWHVYYHHDNRIDQT